LAITFRDRREAGRLLGSKLSSYAGRPDVVVLGLPRGGVPVAFEVAKILKVPLDVFVVRKLGVPGDVELAMGATATGKVRVLNEDVIKRLAIPDEVIELVAKGGRAGARASRTAVSRKPYAGCSQRQNGHFSG
jgi:putative phosphoribosyl transferase